MDSISLDNSAPLPVRRPATVAEVGDLVKQARAAKQGVYPIGGLTSLEIGLPPIKPGIALDTTRLNQVIDYPARDMTITVQAGVTLAALQAQLTKEGQWLPIDVPRPELATLGGAIALNQSGPRRYGHGTLRDFVIGISFVTDDGVEVRAGGRVVKNVAGYDTMKLQIGAVGTLGVVTQVTLKVKPKPEASAAVSVGCDSASLAFVLDAVHASKTRPIAVELTRPSVAEWVVTVGFEEKAATVRWQVETLLAELKPLPVRNAQELPTTAFCEANTALQCRAESRFIGKLIVPPSKLAETVTALPASATVHAHALSGVIWVHSNESLPDGAIVRRCPVDRKKTLAVWGKTTPDRDLMRHIKQTLDPDNVFNPGRLFGDL